MLSVRKHTFARTFRKGSFTILAVARANLRLPRQCRRGGPCSEAKKCP
jgi:hypothetical protein